MGKCVDSAGESAEDARVNIQEYQYCRYLVFFITTKTYTKLVQ